MASNPNVNKVVYGNNTLIDISGDNVTAGDVLSGKTFHTKNGASATGSMTNNGAVSGTISTKAGTYSVPAGYHNGSGSVGISSTEQAKIISSNIKSGVTILGVAGSASAAKPEQSKSTTATMSTQTIYPDSGYALSSVTVNPQVHGASYNVYSYPNRSSVDMGENHNYRYVRTAGLYKQNTSTSFTVPKNNFEYNPLRTSDDFYGSIKAQWPRTVFHSFFGANQSTTWTKCNFTDSDAETASDDSWATRIDPDFGYINSNGDIVVDLNAYGDTLMPFQVTLAVRRGRTSSNTAIYSYVRIKVNGTVQYSLNGDSSSGHKASKNLFLNLKNGDVISVESRINTGTNGGYSSCLVYITTKYLETYDPFGNGEMPV